jgi:thiol-disulfide isomerase/thioredoxin
MVWCNSKRTVREKLTGLLAMAVLAGCAAAVQAQQEGQAPAEERQPAAAAQQQGEKVDDKSRQVLDRVAKFYRSLEQTKVVASMSVEMQGRDPQPPMTLSIAAERPNKFAVPAGEGNDEYRFISDGEKLYQYISAPLNKYSEDPAPESFAALANSGMFAAAGMGTDLSSFATAPHIVVMHLLEGRPLTDVKGVQRVQHAGMEALEGQPHEHIRLIGDEVDVDMWFTEGEEPWLTQVRPDMTKTFEQYGEAGEHLKASMPKVTLSFHNWQKEPNLAEDAFAFTPPDGAEKVESLMKALQEAMGGGGEPDAAHADLLGKPAPEINIDLLDGGKVDLANHKNQVVVLDFWATWCGPCVQGLPILTKVTDKYKDQGVVFYAVNVGESAAKVRTFLEKRELNIKVPMDSDMVVNNRYGVSGIPHTVLIGKDGTIQAIHVGFGPGVEERLTRELETLIKGEKLHKN